MYTYCYSDPINNIDPTGNIVDTFADIGFFIWDIVDIIKNPTDWTNWAALGADGACTFIPGATGGGRTIKIIAKGAEGTKKLTHVEKALLAVDKGEKLSTKMKDVLRAESRTFMKKSSNNFLKAVNKGEKLQVHHLIPLEYAHLMGKGFDPNNLYNLFGVDSQTHIELNRFWSELRGRYKDSEITKDVVLEYAEISIKLFGENFVK